MQQNQLKALCNVFKFLWQRSAVNKAPRATTIRFPEDTIALIMVPQWQSNNKEATKPRSKALRVVDVILAI